jgi:hypothetical protein
MPAQLASYTWYQGLLSARWVARPSCTIFAEAYQYLNDWNVNLGKHFPSQPSANRVHYGGRTELGREWVGRSS